jgi:hypothetical protein
MDAAVSVVRLIFICRALPAEQPVTLMLGLHSALAVAFNVMAAKAVLKTTSLTLPYVAVHAVRLPLCSWNGIEVRTDLRLMT